MRSVKKLFITTIALTFTSFLMKTVAVWFNVYLTGLIGTVGVGIFQLIMSVYAMAKTLAYGGMNLAATRLCIDDFAHRRHTMRRLLFTAGSIGVFAMILLYSFADQLAEAWIMTRDATVSMQILSISLPFVSLSAAYNGYMTASRKMNRYSLIQLLEQFAKIALTVLIVGHLGFTDTKMAIGMVCLAITVSEVFSFSLALISYLHDVKKEKMGTKGKKGFIKRMLRLALPDALGSYIRSGLNTLEHLLIPRGIRSSGASTEIALSHYGIVQGMALPLLLYPSSILGVVSGLLVPEIAECKLKKNDVEVNYIINRVLQVAMIFSMITAAVMLIFSRELSLSVYRSEEAAFYLKLIAPLIPIMYLDMTTDGMLKGLDLQFDIMKINILDSLLCVILVAVLVPKMAVEGYILTIYAAEIINFLLSFRKLATSSKMHVAFMKSFLKPLLASIGASLLGRSLLSVTVMPTFNLILSISATVLIYILLLRISGAVTKDDSHWFFSLVKPT